MKLVLLALCVAAASAALRGQADPLPVVTDTNRNPGSSPDTGATYNKARITGAGQNYVHGTTHAKFVDDANNHPEAKNTANSPPFPGGLSKEAMTEDAMKTIPPQEPPALVKHNVRGKGECGRWGGCVWGGRQRTRGGEKGGDALCYAGRYGALEGLWCAVVGVL